MLVLAAFIFYRCENTKIFPANTFLLQGTAKQKYTHTSVHTLDTFI